MEFSSDFLDLSGLQDANVDLVNWLVEQDEGQQSYSVKQDFLEGAKEIYSLPVAQESCSNYDEGGDVYDTGLHDCLSLDLRGDHWQDRLTGVDAEWARRVALEYQAFQQRRKSGGTDASDDLSQAFQQRRKSGGSDDMSSLQASSCWSDDLSSSPQRWSEISSPPNSNFYSPDYQQVFTPFQAATDDTTESMDVSPNYDSLALCEEKFDKNSLHMAHNQDVVSNVEEALPAEPLVIKVGLDQAFSSPSIRVVDCDVKPNEHLNNSNVIYCRKFSFGDSKQNVSESIKLKNVIESRGDEILEEMVQPTFSTVRRVSLDSMSAADDDTTRLTKRKRVPFSREEKKGRKKEQNKRAATRYREKKKSETDELIITLSGEEEKQTKLKDSVKQRYHELMILRSLLARKHQRSLS